MNPDEETDGSAICKDCGKDLSDIHDDEPCPECGSTNRKYSLSCKIKMDLNTSVNSTLIIGRNETDRLLGKDEYAAALLVSAVDLEAVLGHHLGSQEGTLGRKIGQVENKLECEVFSIEEKEWDKYINDIKKLKFIRDNIAHERGKFRKISRIKEGDEITINDRYGNKKFEISSKGEIKELINRTYEFCKENST